MSHLFDTNAIVHLMKLREPLASRARATDPSTLAVSTITLAELWYGAARSQRPQRTRAEQDAALAPFRVLHFDADAADRYASVRAHLAAAGQLIGDRDLMIAAIALANRLTVITSNTGEFARVPGLKVENWMAE
ncbi:MAG: type II toxin-antitoxin system VapC family toxin [Candidatus Binatia bacterium]